VAGGRSARFGGSVPKQYCTIVGRTVLERSVRSLAEHPSVDGVIVVLPPEDVQGVRGQEVRRIPGVSDVVPGGDTRAASCRNGVAASGPAPWVLVHDAARPWADLELVGRVVEATLQHGAAVPVVPLRDTLKVRAEDGFVAETLDRNRILAAQTPQGARGDWLLEALDSAFAAGVEVTDEAAALERAGRRVRLVDGNPANVKITTRTDLEEAIMKTGSDSPGTLRVGHGFDVHRFEKGRPLFLGGVEFAGEDGLAGHSDADVVLHAAMDAVLGALVLGDIGAHFPPDDPRYAGARSTDLATEVARLADRHGGRVVNLDLTLLAERPRIRARVEDMRRSIASCLGIGVDRVGLKATTLEGLGALGREEGIACHAVALVSVGGADR
jgi:2-C-methyl-D-erythritol 4-phosphate cytidylyltransferase/2-C-methyl-D-erythritol 2,4-cyclodiphosphate synthase